MVNIVMYMVNNNFIVVLFLLDTLPNFHIFDTSYTHLYVIFIALVLILNFMK